MSTVTLPPTGAKIRITTAWPNKCLLVVEGYVLSYPVSGRYVILGSQGGRTLTAYLYDDDGGTVTVDVLEPAPPAPQLPPEPGNYAFVHIAPNDDPLSHTAAQRVGADESWIARWFVIGNERCHTWAQICAIGKVTPMVPDPAADASTSHGIYTQPGEGTEFTRVEVSGDMVIAEGSGSVEMTPSLAEAMGATYLAAARAAREAGQQ